MGGLVRSKKVSQFITMTFLCVLAALPFMQTIVFVRPVVAEEPSSAGQVVINEVYSAPKSGENEWIELYNTTDQAISLDGWRIALEHTDVVFGGPFANGSVIQPHGFFIQQVSGDSGTLPDSQTSLLLKTSEPEQAFMHQLTYTDVLPGKSYGLGRDGAVTRHKLLEAATKNQTNNERCKNVVEADCAAPTASLLTEPAHNAIKNGGPATYGWQASEGAYHYLFESYRDAQMITLHERQIVSANYFERFEPHDTALWWRVKAISEGGKEGEWSEIRRVTIDNVVPVLRHVTEGEYSVVSGTAAFAFEINDQYPNKIVAAMDDAQAQARASETFNSSEQSIASQSQQVNVRVTLNVDTTRLTEGPHKLTVYANDHAGNTSDSIAVEFVVDNQLLPEERDEQNPPGRSGPIGIIQTIPLPSNVPIAPILGGEQFVMPKEIIAQNDAKLLDTENAPTVDAEAHAAGSHNHAKEFKKSTVSWPMWLGFGAVLSGGSWWLLSGRRRA